MPLDQGWATVFVREPHCPFICASRAGFVKRTRFKLKKTARCGPNVVRGPYVAPSCIRHSYEIVIHS
jgi:hypothetical protein